MTKPFITVGAVFTEGTKPYIYKADPADGYQAGEKAAVEVKGHLKLVTIVEVHDTPQIDPEAKYKYGWLAPRNVSNWWAECRDKEGQFATELVEARENG